MFSSDDDAPVKVTFSDYRPVGQSEFELHLRKEAEGGIKPEDNENAPPKRLRELYDDPQGRRDGSNTDGQWGEPPHEAHGKQEPFHQNNSTYAAAQKERKDVTSRSFATLPKAEQQDQSYMASLLDHAKSGDFTTHAVTLLGKSKEGSAPTLSQRVKALTGRT